MYVREGAQGDARASDVVKGPSAGRSLAVVQVHRMGEVQGRLGSRAEAGRAACTPGNQMEVEEHPEVEVGRPSAFLTAVEGSLLVQAESQLVAEVCYWESPVAAAGSPAEAQESQLEVVESRSYLEHRVVALAAVDRVVAAACRQGTVEAAVLCPALLHYIIRTE